MSADRAASMLTDTWSEDLRKGAFPGGDLDFSLSVAYYAHLLRKSSAQSAASDSGFSDDEAQLFMAWAKAYGIPVEKAQGMATLPFRQIITWLAKQENRTTEAITSLVVRFIREVNEYFTSESKRHQVRSLVENEIKSKHPDLIIAHSLGSVVAYEALWNSGHPVESLLTVGSPLGLRGGIFDRVVPGPVEGLGKKPDNVGRWFNVADRGDIVAVPRFLSRSYAGISSDQEINIGLFAFHGLSKYLQTSHVGQLIRFGDVTVRD
ncbi:serine peptidase [Streptomyces sp. 2231.1]|uniref:serine peptidase n=1 Tax=Streptomyces sp. 2231.1 TaxID=1855347 RepID=UPI00115FCF24|nr:serine peptidase [Streptomyces sp. 2231.1]